MKILTLFAAPALATLALLAAPSAALAQDARLSFGGDEYAAGQNVAISAEVARDAFMAGYDVSLSAPVSGDGHFTGFNVRTSAPVAGDIYAAGFNVSVGGDVGGDLTAVGNSVTDSSPVAGNARLAGQTVTLDAPVAGAALIAAQTLNLNSSIAGDLNFIGESISFGPGAKVDGQVHIQAPSEIDVPANVAAADRVSFTELVRPDYVGEAGRTAEKVVRGFWPIVWGTLIWVLVLIVLGAILIAVLPRLRQSLETNSAAHPFRTFWVGILTFASTIGLVPVAALTIIGLFILPFVLLYVVVASVLAYLTGVYLAGLKVVGAFTSTDTNLKRLVALAISVVAAVLLGFIPFVGWLLSLGLLSYGFGAAAVSLMARWAAKDAARAAVAAPADTVAPSGQ